MIWLILAFIVITVFWKNVEKDDWFNSIGCAIIVLLATSWLWIPITEKIPAPGSQQTIPYQAEATPKPSIKSPSVNDEYMEVVETVNEAKPGTKKVYNSLVFNTKHETVLTEAQPAKYAVKQVKNPKYQPPKPVYTPPQPTYTPTPPVQNQSRCPITTCCDGTCSRSRGRGTCSWHGGVCG